VLTSISFLPEIVKRHVLVFLRVSASCQFATGSKSDTITGTRRGYCTGGGTYRTTTRRRQTKTFPLFHVFNRGARSGIEANERTRTTTIPFSSSACAPFASWQSPVPRCNLALASSSFLSPTISTATLFLVEGLSQVRERCTFGTIYRLQVLHFISNDLVQSLLVYLYFVYYLARPKMLQ
jgi:hypothetical protein